MKIPIFGTLKDAYDKYILMDNRMSEIEKRLEKLESIVQKPAQSKFSCKACDNGTYRPTDKPRLFHGMKVGSIWKCDKCGHTPEELQSQNLEQA